MALTKVTYSMIDGAPVSVLDFGAVGDGSTDDTTALQAWLTYISANKKIGFLPAGTYKFTSTLTIGANSDWGIAGEGSAVVALNYAGATTTSDLLVVGDGVDNLINCNISGFKVDSVTTMTGGVGVHLKRLCRSIVDDVVVAGQDGSANLWHGVRFNGVDNVIYRNFEIKAQKDGLQVNGLIGSNPKADLMLDSYKIASCDVGIRYGGAYGGGTVGMGSVAVCGDSVVVDNTLVAEVNREIFFTSDTVLDAPTRCNIIVDQSTASQMRINIPAKMWCASSASHGIWIKNANGAKIDINAYIYNVGGDGIRIDDATAFVTINGFFNNITAGFAVNQTVATVLVDIGTDFRVENVPNPFNYISNRAQVFLPYPIGVQSGRTVFWDNFDGTLDGSGNALFAHGKSGDYYKQVIGVFAVAKGSSGTAEPLQFDYVDGTNISLTGSAPLAGQPYNVFVMLGDIANSGW